MHSMGTQVRELFDIDYCNKKENHVMFWDSGSAGMELRNNLGLGVRTLHPYITWGNERNAAYKIMPLFSKFHLIL